jgi:hypothetical protein
MVENVLIKVEVDSTEVDKLSKQIGRIPEELESMSDPFKGMNKSINEQVGILEKLRAKEKELIAAREKSQNPAEIKKFNKELANTQKEIATLTAATTVLGRAFKAAVAALGPIAAGFALVETVRSVVETTATFEKFKAVLTNTLGSQRAAAEAFDLITKTAATTPFSLEQVTDAYIKLANRGLKPTELALKSFADIAASQGKELDQFVEAALDATQGEFERLKEFGIKANKAGEQIIFSFKGIKESVENTPESINAFLVALGQVEGVAGATDSISQTLTGTWSNLKDNAGQLAGSLGTILLPVLNGLLGAVNFLVSGFTKLVNGAISFGKDAYAVVTGTEAIRKVTKDFEADTLAVNDAVKKESDELNKLYKNLINTASGTQARTDAITALQAKYGKTIDLQGLENAGLGQIAKSQAKANTEILNAIKIKEKQAIIDKLQNQLKQGYYKNDADAIQLINTNIKSLQDEIKQLQTVETQTATVSKEDLKKREKAWKDYVDGIKNLQKELANLRAENNLAKIEDENARARTKIAQDEFKALADLEEQAIKDGTIRSQEYAQVKLEIEKKYQLEYEKLKKEQFEKERAKTQALGKDLVEIQTTGQKAASEKSSDIFAEEFAKREDLQGDWLKDWEKFNAQQTKAQQEQTELRKQYEATAIQAITEVSNAAFEILAQQRQAQLEQTLAAISTEFTAQQTAIQKEIELRQSQGKNTEDLEKKLAASKEAQRKKEAQIKTEAAKKEKAAAIIQAIINTALAIASANTLVPPANIPAMVLAGAAGAAQIALIAAQPIPKYAEGTLNVTGGRPNKDSVHAMLMPGEAVIPKKTNKAYGPAIEAIYSGSVAPSTANQLLTLASQVGLNGFGGSQVINNNSGGDVVNVTNSIDGDGLNTYIERNGNRKKWLNKRYNL